MNPYTGVEPDAGYVVSIRKDREQIIPADRLTADAIAQYVRRNWSELNRAGQYLGGWHEPGTGRVYLDVSTVVRTEPEAVRLSLEHNQQAYFDLGRMETVEVTRPVEVPVEVPAAA